MTAVKSFLQVKGHPAFDAFAENADRWTHEGPNGARTKCEDFRASSPYGSVASAVVVDEKGRPIFDRPVYYEAPNVHAIVYGRDTDGKIRVAVISQPRPHADDPMQPGNDHPPVIFGQTPMGFLLSKIAGNGNIVPIETGAAGAMREAGEEAGVQVVISVTQPKYPHINPNPTFVATWSEVYFLEVDLHQIRRLKPDHAEPIFSAEYLTVPELLRRIREGQDEKGAVYRMGVSLGDWMIFFATHPEFFTAE